MRTGPPPPPGSRPPRRADPAKVQTSVARTTRKKVEAPDTFAGADFELRLKGKPVRDYWIEPRVTEELGAGVAFCLVHKGRDLGQVELEYLTEQSAEQSYRPGDLCIRDIRVKRYQEPEYQGVGKLLVLAAVQTAQRLGARRVVAFATDSQLFFAKVGLQPLSGARFDPDIGGYRFTDRTRDELKARLQTLQGVADPDQRDLGVYPVGLELSGPEGERYLARAGNHPQLNQPVAVARQKLIARRLITELQLIRNRSPDEMQEFERELRVFVARLDKLPPPLASELQQFLRDRPWLRNK